MASGFFLEGNMPGEGRKRKRYHDTVWKEWTKCREGEINMVMVLQPPFLVAALREMERE